MYTEQKEVEGATPEPRRRRYTEEFKADVIAQCQQEGISIARVALAHGLNANLLRRWIGERQQGEPAGNELTVSPEPRFVELAAPALAPAAVAAAPSPATIVSDQ